MKLSLCMIAKGEIKNLKRLHPLVKDYIDEWVVVVPPKDKAVPFLRKAGAKVIVKDFTQGIEPEVIEAFKDYELDVDKDYRLFNFAAARNESFRHATGDYVLWLDADDEPVGLDRLKDILADNPSTDIFEAVYDYSRDEQGNSVSDQIRERIVRNNPNFAWSGGALGLIHETLEPKRGVNAKYHQLPPDEFKVVHHSDHVDQSSIRNHVALSYEYIKTDGSDARTLYYLGVSFFNLKQYGFCVKLMHEYIKVGGWDEERYRAWIRMAEAYHQLGDKDSSRNAYLNAVKELPDYPDAYMGLGESYFSSEQYSKAVEFLLTGMQKPIPDTKSAVDRVKYLFRPLPYLALANIKMGKIDDGYAWYQKAKKINPDDPWVVRREAYFERTKDFADFVKGFVKIGQLSQVHYPDALPKLADAIPDELKGQELLLEFKRRYSTPKVWPDNSIVFWCSSAFEEWGPDSLKTGTGGSEEAIIQLTKRLAQLGWDVTVFNNCPEEETREGVKWRRLEDFNPRDEFNILVSWRNNAFTQPKRCKKGFIDLHDVPDAKYFREEFLENVTILTKSQYHRSLLPDVPDEKFTVIPNGFDAMQFDRGDD